jgi:hypothetical protein
VIDLLMLGLVLVLAVAMVALMWLCDAVRTK